MPDKSVSKQTRDKWLLEVCEEYVQKFVLNKDELISLVGQTTELESVNLQSRWTRCVDDCNASYAYHSGRVRYILFSNCLRIQSLWVFC